ncbi:MAG TPA: hypothetical protein PLT68_12060 [Actinomycetota bacterium]|nr:hypothetical protein [Actinomycetota bacterium]
MDPNLVLARPPAAMTFEQAMQESIPEDFALPSERRLAQWLRDGFGLTVMRVRNDESKKSPDAVVPTGAWIGTVDFKELTTLNSLRSEIAEGSLQSSRMVIDMVGDEVTQAQLAEHIRLGIWGAPSQVTEVIVRHRGLVLHWKLP